MRTLREQNISSNQVYRLVHLFELHNLPRSATMHDQVLYKIETILVFFSHFPE